MRFFIYMIFQICLVEQAVDPLVFYKCLAEETRLKSLLLIHLHQELCVCDLTAALQQSQPKVSRHLAALRQCRLLSDERRGKWVFYRIHPTLPTWARQVLDATLNQHTAYLQEERQRLLAALPSTHNRCCL